MNMEKIIPDEKLDTTGLSCPMPLLKTKKKLLEMAVGKILEVTSSDPGSQKDIPKIGNKGSNTYLGHLAAENNIFKYYIRRG
jgi:tRNA 2-thiouridine synthesizing protein A